MSENVTVYVGTVGQSIWHSRDGGQTFARASKGAPMECDVRALLIHPRDSRILHLGAETGLFGSPDGAENWERVASPMDGMQVWTLARDPNQPDVLFAGTCPAGLYRSADGGR